MLRARGGSNNKPKQVNVFLILLLLQQWGTHNVMASASSNSDGSTTTAGTVSSLLRCFSKWMMMMVEEDRATRPFVTLSFAQSLDGKIALSSSSSNFPISCPESLILTHALRSVHDAVLVGSETMRTDNPRLTVRLWGKCPTTNPRPVVLDTHLRCDYAHCRARNVIVCCSEEAAAARGLDDTKRDDDNITLLPCTVSPSSSHLDLRDVLGKLHMKFGIRSIMVEGGARVLSNFANENLVDCMCVTISPMVLGTNGLAAFQHLTNTQEAPALGDLVWDQIGVDSILLKKIQ